MNRSCSEGLAGGNGNDRLLGGDGTDQLNGGAGSDQITGGKRGDQLTSGLNKDLYIYTDRLDSVNVAGEWDLIVGFSKRDNDQFDFSALWTSSGGNLSFVRAQKTNAVASSVTWHQSSDQTYVQIDLDGNAGNGAEMKIQLTGLISLASSDFILRA